MFDIKIDESLPKEAFYQELSAQLEGLFYGERDLICNAAQLSAFIMQSVPDLNWAGFYFLRGQELVLGPYVGKVACTRIPLTKGVCGAAVSTKTTQRVTDVHQFPGHIACDGDTRSELVLPIFAGDVLIGVLDLDSPIPDRFDEKDQFGVQELANIFVKSTDFQWALDVG